MKRLSTQVKLGWSYSQKNGQSLDDLNYTVDFKKTLEETELVNYKVLVTLLQNCRNGGDTYAQQQAEEEVKYFNNMYKYKMVYQTYLKKRFYLQKS